jgi:hypothetical protein
MNDKLYYYVLCGIKENSTEKFFLVSSPDLNDIKEIVELYMEDKENPYISLNIEKRIVN